MNIDRGTNEAIELISQGSRLTASLLAFIFRKASEGLEDKRNVIDGSTKEGKQKINDLLEKHKDGIETLDENLTKEQVKEYKKELKKLGVDFSVVKNGKDNYSFFFAGSQSNVIEKALQNIIEKEEIVQSNEKVKEAELDVNAEKNKHTEKEIESVEKVYVNTKDKDSPIDSKEFKELSSKEQELYIKISELDKIEKEVHEQVTNAFNEMRNETTKNVEDISKEKEIIKNEKTEVKTSKVNTQTKEFSKNILNSELQELSNKELSLFEKRMEYESLATAPEFNERETYRVAEEYKEMKKNFSKDQINKINNLDKNIRDLNNFSEKSQSHKLNANEILSETRRNISERSSNKKKVFSMDNIKKIDQKIKAEETKKDRTKHKEHSR